MKVRLIMAVALSLQLSCSVKEDRTQCPCRLLFSEENFSSSGYDGDMTVSVFGSGNSYNGLFDINRLCRPETEISVNRGPVTVCGIGGIGNMARKGSILEILPGFGCDSLYAFRDDINAEGETAEVTVRVEKQFSSMLLVMKGRSEGEYPYGVRVTGKVCGIDMRTLEPVRGDFDVVLKPLREKFGQGVGYRINLPRQTDDSLVLNLFDSDRSYAIPIGKYLEDEFDFDWKIPSLPDIMVEVDFSVADFSIAVEEWEQETEMNVTI